MQDIKDGDRLILYIGDRVLARKVFYCQSGASRRDGLLGRKELSLDEGILMKMPGGRQGKSGFLTNNCLESPRFKSWDERQKLAKYCRQNMCAIIFIHEKETEIQHRLSLHLVSKIPP